jgi:transposase
MKIINAAVDEVRRDESKENALLKKTRYLWLKNPPSLRPSSAKPLESLKYQHLDTGRAYNLKLSFRDFFTQPNRAAGEEFLKRWYYWATHSKLVPMIQAAKARARGYRNVKTLITMAYIVGSRLDYGLPKYCLC